MRKFLLSTFLFLSLVGSAFALPTQESPDCSKDLNFYKTFISKGFVSVLSFEDKVNSTEYVLMFNYKTNEDMIISISKDGSKTCLVSVGDTKTSNINLELLRDVFDNLSKGG